MKEAAKNIAIVCLLIISIGEGLFLAVYGIHADGLQKKLGDAHVAAVTSGRLYNECKPAREKAEGALHVCKSVTSAATCDCSCRFYIDILMNTVDYLREKPKDTVWWHQSHRAFKYYEERGFIIGDY